ncbi:MAG: EAL domain-containing protein, partial [Actinomycetota bacterium]|nr:EAL domain-containing protein [Actinomycetota bacterium]
LPARVRAALQSGQATWAPEGRVLLVPLGGPPRGLLALRGVSPEAESDVLERLGGLVGLALEQAGLTEELIHGERRYRSMLQSCSVLIGVVDADGTLSYLSPAVARMLGYAPAALTGYPFEALVHADDTADWRRFLTEVLSSARPLRLDCRLRHRHRPWLHAEVVGVNLLDEPSVAGVMINVRDASEQRTREDELVRRTHHDPLTRLPNRTLFLQRLRAAVEVAERQDSLAVLYVDLDGFKSVNDTYGHAVGDGLLESVAERIHASLRPDDTASRLSGDEFAVLVDKLRDREEARQVAERLLASLGELLPVHDHTLSARASVGVAVGGTGVEDAEDLLHRADLAMYTAKGEGGNRIQVYHPDAHATLGARRQLQAELQWAVLRGELDVRYQPVVALDDRRISAAEALVRWRHPARGLLGPDAFVSLAEEGGLITDVFDFVLRDACTRGRGWQSPEGDGPSVNVNLSAVQLRQAELVNHVSRVLEETGLAPHLLILEVTESVLVDDPHAAAEALATLKQLGVRIAIDDFGTGYSSLAYLRRLPIDVLKVDKSFLQGIDRPYGAAVARTVLELGQRLGMPTIVEGVETAAQVAALKSMGYTHVQGYFFSRPVPGDRVGELLARGKLRGRSVPAVPER